MKPRTFVPVFSVDKKTLMSTTHSRAAKWVASGRATPFWFGGCWCVRMNEKTKEIVQNARGQNMLATKNSRNITVDTQAFRWKVSVDKEFLSVVAESRDDPKGRLVIRLNYPAHGEPQWQVTPSLVASLIRDAIENGWDHTAKGEHVVHSKASPQECYVQRQGGKFHLMNLPEDLLRQIMDYLQDQAPESLIASVRRELTRG